MTWISFRVPNVCEALKTQKNPRHVPCPLKSNRTAVGLTRQSILFERVFSRMMDARVKPAHDVAYVAAHCLIFRSTISNSQASAFSRRNASELCQSLANR